MLKRFSFAKRPEISNLLFLNVLINLVCSFIIYNVYPDVKVIHTDNGAAIDYIKPFFLNDIEDVSKKYSIFNKNCQVVLALETSNTKLQESRDANDLLINNDKRYRKQIAALNDSINMFTNAVSNNDRLKVLDTIIFAPTDSSYIYELKPHTKTISIFLKSKYSLPSNFIELQTQNYAVMANSSELVNDYAPTIGKLNSIATATNEEFNDLLKKRIIIIMAILISVNGFFILLVLLFGFNEAKTEMEHIKNKKEVLALREKVVLQTQEETLKAQTLQLEKEKILRQKELTINRREHGLTHDTKTNLDRHLNWIMELRRKFIKCEGCAQKEEIDGIVLKLYGLEKFLKLSLESISVDPSNKYVIANDFPREYFLKYLQLRKTPLKSDIIKTDEDFVRFYFDVDIHIGDLPIGAIQGNFYAGEFSSAVFRLLHNALKHSTFNTKIIFTLRSDINSIDIFIKNNVAQDYADEVCARINNSFENGNLKLVKDAMDKHKFTINVFSQDDKAILHLSYKAS